MPTPHSKLVKDVFYALCKHMDTPVSLGLWLRFKYGEYHQLVTKTVNPNDYTQIPTFKKDYLCSEYLSKYPGFVLDINPSEVAFSAFNDSEKSCYETNNRLRFDRGGQIPPRVSPVLFLASRKISNLLGDFSFKWLELCKWGPGVTSSLSGDVNIGHKLREEQISITRLAVPYFQAATGVDIHWMRARGINAEGPISLLPSEFQVVEGCRYTTVPKSAKTDRNIAIEPTGNQFLQGGLGLYIRSRLRRVGIDLRTQSHNQKAAAEALEKSLATVDLSAASDSISRELIWTLLPVEWANCLDRLRSPSIKIPIDGVLTYKPLEKFSSMGNGFTFELETLLFWALSQSVCDQLKLKHQVIVYGDDIIIPTAALPLLEEVFAYVGFTINSKKTHAASLFRESCGVHFFDSVDCTPIYLREIPKSEDRIMIMHNQLVRLAQRWSCWSGYLDNLFKPAISRVKQASSNKYRIPLYASGDDGLLCCSSEIGTIPPHGKKLPVLQAVPLRDRVSPKVLMAYWLRFVGRENEDSYLISTFRSLSLSSHGEFSFSVEMSDRKGRIARRNATVYHPRKRRFASWETGEIRWLVPSD